MRAQSLLSASLRVQIFPNREDPVTSTCSDVMAMTQRTQMFRKARR